MVDSSKFATSLKVDKQKIGRIYQRFQGRRFLNMGISRVFCFSWDFFSCLDGYSGRDIVGFLLAVEFGPVNYHNGPPLHIDPIHFFTWVGLYTIHNTTTSGRRNNSLYNTLSLIAQVQSYINAIQLCGWGCIGYTALRNASGRRDCFYRQTVALSISAGSFLLLGG